MLAVLLADTVQGRRRPELAGYMDLVCGAVRVWLHPRVPRSQRSVFTAIRVMWLGAALELAAAITIVLTVGDVRDKFAQRHPGYPPAQWHAVLTGRLVPLAVSAGAAVGFWLWMAWSIGRGHRWSWLVFVVFVAANVDSLGQGLVRGSAVYARPDLMAGAILCLVELVAVVFAVRVGLSAARRRPAR